jgi:hypothetical protein
MQTEQLCILTFGLMSVSVPLDVSDLLEKDWKSDAKEMRWNKGMRWQHACP